MAAGPASRPSRWRRHAGPVLVFGIATLVAFLSLMLAGVNRADEAWNLHLVDLMLRGEVLYTDIRYFPTPLALFAGVGAAAIFGVNVVVLKALMAVAFGVTATANLFIARMLFAGRRARLLLLVALLLFALPTPSSLYNTLVITFASVTAALVLHWDEALKDLPGPEKSRRLVRLAAAVGVAAGACALTKYNIGAAAIVATAGSMAVPLIQRRVAFRDFAVSGLTASGACLLTVLAGLVPVLLQDAGGDFVRQLRDGPQLIDAPVPYGYFLRRLIDGVAHASTLEIRNFGSYGLVPLAGALGLIAVVRSRSIVRGRLVMVLLFCLAAAVLAFPRADHMPWVVPLPLALLIGSASVILQPLRRVRPEAVTALGACALGFAVTWFGLAVYLEASAARDFEVMRTGHFQGALAPPGDWRRTTLAAEEIRRHVGPDRNVLILHLDAGFYYLAADLRNPTRYHYPDSFEFGEEGLAAVGAALRNQTIRYTCIGHDYTPELEPERVIAAVRAHSYLVAKLGVCDLWRTGPDPQRPAPMRSGSAGD